MRWVTQRPGPYSAGGGFPVRCTTVGQGSEGTRHRAGATAYSTFVCSPWWKLPTNISWDARGYNGRGFRRRTRRGGPQVENIRSTLVRRRRRAARARASWFRSKSIETPLPLPRARLGAEKVVVRVHVTPEADGVADLRPRAPFRARERGRRRLGESPKPRGRASPVETPRAAGSVRTPRPCGRGHDAPWEASRRNGPRSARRRRTSTTQCRRRPRRAREKNVGPDPARLGPDPAVERPRRVAPRGRRGPVPAAPPSRSARGDARSNGREARRGAPRAPQPSCRRRLAAHFRRSPTKSRPRRPLAGRPDELQLDHRKSRCLPRIRSVWATGAISAK